MKFKVWLEGQANLISLVIYTKDSHPADHISFKTHGGQWPPHCIVGTKGHRFHPDLIRVPHGVEVEKGASGEAYSAFENTNLASKLISHNIKRCLIVGLASDYCVKHTALDSLRFGFETYILTDAIAAVNDNGEPVEIMSKSGAKMSTVKEIIAIMRQDPKPTSLIVVDVQEDFCPGGSLAVPNADRIIRPINWLLSQTL